MLDPDVLTTAILIPDLKNTDILEPIHEHDHGRRIHREGVKIQHLSNKISLFGLCACIRGYLAPSIGQQIARFS